MGYELRGRMAEACTCETFCPCTAGLEPDGGACEFSWVFHFDAGQIEGVDVTGLNVGMLGHLDGAPGTPGQVRLALFVDDRASDDQEQAILAAYTGKAGGPLADLAGLVGEVVTVERAAIEFDVDQGTGSMRIGDIVSGRLDGLRGPAGDPTKIQDFALSGVLGRTGYVAAPVDYELRASHLGFEFEPRTATQFEFHHVVA